MTELESKSEKLDLPFSAHRFEAPSKKFAETIILVPFYGARSTSLKRHVELFNRLGYDVVTFHLYQETRSLSGPLFSSAGQFGFKHIWADQIEVLLNCFPGPKIVFSFSNPSASAIEAIVKRAATDIKGLICDGGPTGNIFKSMDQYFSHEEPIRFWPLRLVASLSMSLIWNPKFFTAIHDDLSQMPKGFPILSIRGWKDPIITPRQIDSVFEPHLQIEWSKVSLPKAAHCNGLKDFKELYEPALIKFLNTISAPVIS